MYAISEGRERSFCLMSSLQEGRRHAANEGKNFAPRDGANISFSASLLNGAPIETTLNIY
jgi:hypothetical protein